MKQRQLRSSYTYFVIIDKIDLLMEDVIKVKVTRLQPLFLIIEYRIDTMALFSSFALIKVRPGSHITVPIHLLTLFIFF